MQKTWKATSTFLLSDIEISDEELENFFNEESWYFSKYSLSKKRGEGIASHCLTSYYVESVEQKN